MADSNLSQEEIDALLGGVESIIAVPKDDTGSPAAPAPAAPAPAAPAFSALDEFSLDFGRELMNATIGNSHEAFSDILNVTAEFAPLGFEEHSPETLRKRFAPEAVVAVDGEIGKPLPGQMLLLARRDFALVMGDMLMGNDGSAPNADMEKVYIQAIGEAAKRFAQAAVAPKMGELLGHPFTVEFKNPRAVLTSGPADFGLRHPVLLGGWRVSAQVAPDRAVPIELWFAVDANFLTQANPVNLEKHVQKPAPAPAAPAAKPAPAPAATGGIPSLDQSEIDALLSRVQQSVGAPSPPPQAAPPQTAPPQAAPGYPPPPQSAPPQTMPGYPSPPQSAPGYPPPPQPAPARQPAPAPEPVYAYAGAAPPPAEAAAQQPPQAPGWPAPPPGTAGPYGPYGPYAPQGPWGGVYGGAPYMSSQQPPFDPNAPGGMPPQGPGYPPPGHVYGQGFPPGGQVPPPQPASFPPFQQHPQAQPVNFAPLTYAPAQGVPSNIELLLDVPLQITVELGRTKMQIKEILELTEGSIVGLDKIAGESIDLLVNNKLVAKGEVVVIDENFGIRITSIVSQADRLASTR